MDAYLSERVRPEGDCWVWTLTPGNHGYGDARLGGVRTTAHRFSYEYHRAEVPDGLQLDHLCRNRLCINPWHLEPVTQKVNLHRGLCPNFVIHRSGRCSKGHERSEANTYITSRGTQVCRPCRRAREAKAKASR